jgi:two-component system sensor histidine kinase VicK
VKAGASIVRRLEPGLPKVSGDESRLGEVVRTLLANAARYSPEGGRITVTTAVEGDTVTVSVRDEGVAARADFDNRLFGEGDLYAHNPIRKIVGTGLGLGIVRQVVEMHGGRLWVDQVDGEGSELHFTLRAVETPVIS